MSGGRGAGPSLRKRQNPPTDRTPLPARQLAGHVFHQELPQSLSEARSRDTFCGSLRRFELRFAKRVHEKRARYRIAGPGIRDLAG